LLLLKLGFPTKLHLHCLHRTRLCGLCHHPPLSNSGNVSGHHLAGSTGSFQDIETTFLPQPACFSAKETYILSKRDLYSKQKRPEEQETGQIPDCSFYLPVSVSQKDSVTRPAAGHPSPASVLSQALRQSNFAILAICPHTLARCVL